MEVETSQCAERENEQGLEKTQLPVEEKLKINGKKNEFEIDNLTINNKIEKTKSSSKVLKRKVTEDGVTIERVLSAGEVSSGFETVSSIDSHIDIEDLDLSSFPDEENDIITVEIENDLAFQNIREKKLGPGYWKNKSKSPHIHNYKNYYPFSEHGSKRQDGYRNFTKHQYRPRNLEEPNYMYNKRDKESAETEDNISSRYSTHDHSRNKNLIPSRSSRVKRRDNRTGRSRRSRSSDRIFRYRVSRTPERKLKSPSYKGRKIEARRSRSFERNSTKSSSKRNSPLRKRKKSPLPKSSPSSVWKRLDSRKSPNKLKKNSHKTPTRTHPSRRKERTPFLVELERKLQEAERLKNSINGNFEEKDKTKQVLTNVNDTVSKSDKPSAMEQNTSFSSTYTLTQRNTYPVQCSAMPTFSMENLPLVPGPTGLPVHITMTGEQIPHDIDGRRIPVGPNGFYLPLDPTGRLFAHIVSPGNQAVPIHLTEDGVLRLPNSEPVPYGPGHNLPINIDGKVILIGPDSKPMYPCPDLPKEPPFNLLQMIHCFETVQQSNQMVPQQTLPIVTQLASQNAAKIIPTTQTGNSHTNHLVQKPQNINKVNSKADLNLSDFIQNSSEKVNKADLLKKYKKKAREKSEDVLRCIEIQKNLGVNPSKGGVKRSTPMKLTLKKTSKEDNCTSGVNKFLNSNDSDSTFGVRSGLELAKDSSEEIVLSSDDEQDVLTINCDNGSPKTNAEKSDDQISKKIQRAIKSLCEKNYKPPAFGRFIISDLIVDPVIEKPPNDSPLLKNRIKLPFITPNFNYVGTSCKHMTKGKTVVNFKFLTQKNSTEKVEKQKGFRWNKKYNAAKFPVFTFDFSMQCDFTSITVKNLKTKVSELETEVVRLKNVNANLLESYRNVQEAIEKKDNELRAALLEIQEKHDEIESLKRSIKMRK